MFTSLKLTDFIYFYLEHLLVGRVLATLTAEVLAHALEVPAEVDHSLDGRLAPAAQLPLRLSRLHLCRGSGWRYQLTHRQTTQHTRYPPMSASQSSGSMVCLELPLRKPLEDDSVTPLVKWSTSMSTSLLRQEGGERELLNLMTLLNIKTRWSDVKPV